MTAGVHRLSSNPWRPGVFALSQVAVMLLAISNESLWIDEFWTAHFAAMASFKAFYELLLVPSGSQTPLHFLHFYLWGLIAPAGEFFLRLANLPLFVAGQLALYWALRDYPRQFAWLFLALSALHPMVWQYANEARPYIMMYAGAQMLLAYLLRLHVNGADGRAVEPVFLMFFVVGGILLFGASMLGVFWVFAACAYAAIHHLRHSTWRGLLRGTNLILVFIFLVAIGSLTVYYLSSLLQGAGASRLDSSSPATVLFAAYEVLGLAGLGPSRLDLRALGAAALGPYVVALVAAGSVLLTVVAAGLKEASARLGKRELIVVVALGLLPVAVVIFSGFAMHWRVLGRHLIAALPLLCLVLALGLARLLPSDGHRGQWLRSLLAVACLSILVCSSWSLRFFEQHRKDDYRSAAAIAHQAFSQGKRVWWAADAVGANHYGLPGEFDFMGEMTGMHQPFECTDRPGVQSVANMPIACLLLLSPPDVIVLSKPEGYDRTGGLTEYIKTRQYAQAQSLPAFAVWRAPGLIQQAVR